MDFRGPIDLKNPELSLGIFEERTYWVITS